MLAFDLCVLTVCKNAAMKMNFVPKSWT